MISKVFKYVTSSEYEEFMLYIFVLGLANGNI